MSHGLSRSGISQEHDGKQYQGSTTAVSPAFPNLKRYRPGIQSRVDHVQRRPHPGNREVARDAERHVGDHHRHHIPPQDSGLGYGACEPSSLNLHERREQQGPAGANALRLMVDSGTSCPTAVTAQSADLQQYRLQQSL